MASDILEWMSDHIVPWFFVLIIISAALAIVAIPIYAWHESHAPSFELKKSEWACSASHNETTTSYVLMGKIMTPITSSETVCDQWSRESNTASEVKS